MPESKLTIDYLPITEIFLYENNPRKNDQAVDVVAKSIETYGWRVPIVLGSDNKIISGHTRYKAAVKLGIKEVPVVWADDLSKAEQIGLRIMDNKSSQFADWDFDTLLNEIDELKELDFDTNLTGFSVADLEDIKKTINKEPKEIDENLSTDHQCPKCGYKW